MSTTAVRVRELLFRFSGFRGVVCRVGGRGGIAWVVCREVGLRRLRGGGGGGGGGDTQLVEGEVERILMDQRGIRIDVWIAVITIPLTEGVWLVELIEVVESVLTGRQEIGRVVYAQSSPVSPSRHVGV